MKKILLILIAALTIADLTMAYATGPSPRVAGASGISFIGRGIVKSGGDARSVNVYWTDVPASVERIGGVRSDVNTSQAKIYKWEVNKGKLIKRRTTSLPVPEKQVVIKGTLQSDDRVTASWVVQNYREFKIEGKLQKAERDTGKTDEGYVTVEVTSSVLRNITPVTKFKETQLKGTDLRIRINGQTSVNALGKSKNFDEVNGSQQKVRIEGDMLNEDTWVATKFTELNS